MVQRFPSIALLLVLTLAGACQAETLGVALDDELDSNADARSHTCRLGCDTSSICDEGRCVARVGPACELSVDCQSAESCVRGGCVPRLAKEDARCAAAGPVSSPSFNETEIGTYFAALSERVAGDLSLGASRLREYVELYHRAREGDDEALRIVSVQREAYVNALAALEHIASLRTPYEPTAHLLQSSLDGSAARAPNYGESDRARTVANTVEYLAARRPWGYEVIDADGGRRFDPHRRVPGWESVGSLEEVDGRYYVDVSEIEDVMTGDACYPTSRLAQYRASIDRDELRILSLAHEAAQIATMFANAPVDGDDEAFVDAMLRSLRDIEPTIETERAALSDIDPRDLVASYPLSRAALLLERPELVEIDAYVARNFEIQETFEHTIVIVSSVALAAAGGFGIQLAFRAGSLLVRLAQLAWNALKAFRTTGVLALGGGRETLNALITDGFIGYWIGSTVYQLGSGLYKRVPALIERSKARERGSAADAYATPASVYDTEDDRATAARAVRDATQKIAVREQTVDLVFRDYVGAR